MKIEKTEIIKATSFIAYAKDFAETENWQDAYFQLLAWKNTWYIPIVMDIRSSQKNGAYLYLVVPNKGNIVDHTEQMLENLGYSVNKNEIKVAEFYPEWEDGIDEFTIVW
jgi:hypothetical protein